MGRYLPTNKTKKLNHVSEPVCVKPRVDESKCEVKFKIIYRNC